MGREIHSVAVIGGGTMGSGIAAAAAAAGWRVLLLERDREATRRARERTLAQARDPAEQQAIDRLLVTGTLDESLREIGEFDWICEAIVEDLDAKRALFSRIEPWRREGSVVSTNTSGIPLSAITEGLPDRLGRDIVVTHFFNPVRVMKLLEIVPGNDTDPAVVASLARFCGDVLGKGVVQAKDTVNFIANRIGCFWMLSGLHHARRFRAEGIGIERADALLSAPLGLPATGLYGLIDLIGLDVMALVGRNLAANLPGDDAGRAFTRFPAEEAALLARGQFGRKSGGGFYRVLKGADGQKSREVFDLETQVWRPHAPATLAPHQTDAAGLLFADDPDGAFAWAVHGGTLLYAADLLPAIADDIVNVDRALRWGFGWKRGPFETLDDLGPTRVIARLRAEGRPVPALLRLLEQSGAEGFYRDQGRAHLGLDGRYHPVEG
ncbi:MAG: hypothetical protein RLZZ501_2084 [Pseudomonadota bacterium]|jgi:3-hydroxyacyl-CoA dehydrogenase